MSNDTVKLSPAIKKEAKKIVREMRDIFKTMQALDEQLETKREQLWHCIAQDPVMDLTKNVYNYDALKDKVTIVRALPDSELE